MNEQCRDRTLAEAIFFFPVFRVQSHTVNVWYSLSSIEARYAPWLFWNKTWTTRQRQCYILLEMLAGLATSSSQDLYRSKDRGFRNQNLVGKTGNSGWKIKPAVIWGGAISSSFKPVKLIPGYCKFPKISPGAYIFQRPFLRGFALRT